jgi:hypothetical protein
MGELKAPIGPDTAHLCIDMQRLFSDEGPWPMAWMPRVTPKVAHLVARPRADNLHPLYSSGEAGGCAWKVARLLRKVVSCNPPPA